MRFYRTYEELKLFRVAWETPGSVCFYRTYEELKHDVNNKSLDKLRKFLSYL